MPNPLPKSPSDSTTITDAKTPENGYLTPEQIDGVFAPGWDKPPVCTCEAFRAAQEILIESNFHTDRDEESAILSYGQTCAGNSGWLLATDLPIISFCPWCGKRVPVCPQGNPK